MMKPLPRITVRQLQSENSLKHGMIEAGRQDNYSEPEITFRYIETREMTSDKISHQSRVWKVKRGKLSKGSQNNAGATTQANGVVVNSSPRGLHARSRRGQALVEFSLVFPVMLTIVLGIVEFGRLLVTYSSVATASRDAARYAASVGEDPSGIAHYQDCVGIRGTIDRLGLFLDTSATIMHDPDGPGGVAAVEYCQVGKVSDPINVSLGSQIVVSVTGTYQPLAIWPSVQIPPLPITFDTSRSVVRDVYVK